MRSAAVPATPTRLHADCQRALDHDRVLCAPRGCRLLSLAAVGQAYQHLAIIFARVSLILVNFGFWIGSLWGDYPGETWARGEDYRLWSNREAWRAAHLHVPEIAFIAGWAIVPIAVGAWAARANRRWVVTTAAVFGAIEFYTQWFERLGAEPWAIIVAGLGIVAVSIALWRYNLNGGRPATVTA